MVSIRPKLACRFQAFCTSSIRKRCFRPTWSMRCSKLSHPDTFTQAPTCCFFFFNHLADIVHSVWENHLPQKQIKIRTFVHLCPLPRDASHSPGSISFPGNKGSRDSPPIGVFTALALSFAALSIVGVWAVMLYGTPPKHVDVLSSCSLDWGGRVSYSTPS